MNGQNHDYIWLYGETVNTGAGGNRIGPGLDFSSSPPRIRNFRRERPLDIYSHAMADSAGTQLLYYSDGLHLYNRMGAIMENGDTLNLNEWWWAEAVTFIGGYPSSLSGLSVPYPARPGEYLYFHQPLGRVPGIARIYAPKGFMYTHIDMASNEGLGRVVEKNQIGFDGFSTGIGLTKTGDNAGWWLVHGLALSNVYRVYRVDSAGVHLHSTDTLGANVYEEEQLVEDVGLAVFSPDGTKFARLDHRNGITLLSFDRCRGELTEPQFYPIARELPLPEFFRYHLGSLAFSPNSRFLYYNTEDALMQLDTWAAPTEYALDTIGALQSPSSPLNTKTFAFSELAPDGKIYIAPGLFAFYHTIERPDLPGEACGFRQLHAPIMPDYSNGSVPHFPNYRLEAINCN